MDRRFLEFLGNSFLSAARGQAQMEEMADWFRRSLSGMEGLPAFFLRAYGLDSGTGGDLGGDKATRKTALDDFQKAYGDWIRMMGAVPLSEYRKLEARCEALEKENEDQAKMIRYLSGVLSGEGDVQTTTLNALRELTDRQTEHFSALVTAFSEYLQGHMNGAESPAAEKKGPPPDGKPEE